MGLFFTLLYIAAAYLTPPVLFGELGRFHAEVILAIPAIFFSILNLGEAGVGRMAQTWGVAGLVFAVAMSLAVTGWIGGAPVAMIDFLPFIMVFFFVVCNCRKKGHLQLLAIVLFAVTAFVIAQSQLQPRNPNLTEDQARSSYYMVQGRNAQGEPLYRIQGLGVIGDPNDFGQFMLGLLPAMFFFWRKGNAVLNLLLVYVPTGVILGGIYLTHSRGALLGLAAILVFAFRKRIGLIPSAIGGVLMLGGMIAAGATGGRDVSAAAGEDRMEAWSVGLQLIRSHPIFGVGYRHFTDFYTITAHNTIVVCAAEVGLIGLFSWMIFTVTSLRDCWLIGAWKRADEMPPREEPAAGAVRYGARPALAAGMPALAYAAPKLASSPGSSLLLDPSSVRTAPAPFAYGAQAATQSPAPTPPEPARPMQPSFAAALPTHLPPEEIRRLASLVVLSFVGLCVTGWFLSRCFAMVFFLYGGIAAVVFRMSEEAGMNVPRLRLQQAIKLSIAPTILLVAIIYIVLRIDHLFPH